MSPKTGPRPKKSPKAKKATSPMDTPIMRQFSRIKAEHPNSVVFFRLGDFYEMFNEDAATAAPILGLVLTKRQGIPMCGVPHHSLSKNIGRLLNAGHKIAIAEQVEDPKQAKGIVERKVVRVISPGTIVEEDLLEAKQTNFLAAVEIDLVGWGLACLEVSTGEFWATQQLNDPGLKRLSTALSHLAPAELLVTQKSREELPLDSLLGFKTAVTVFESPTESTVPEAWNDKDVFRNHPLALKAAQKAKQYAFASDPGKRDFARCSFRNLEDRMQIDDIALRTLEVVHSSTGDRRLSLWGALDLTETPLGSRRLKNWLLAPLNDPQEIETRQKKVQELLDDPDARESLAGILRDISDIERVLNRLATTSASPKDLAGLRDSLSQISKLQSWFKSHDLHSPLKKVARQVDGLAKLLRPVRELLEKALVDSPPFKLSEGGVIREGYDSDLDEIRGLRGDSQAWLKKFQAQEQERSGIPTLKIGYNSVFGYYIEITNAHKEKAPVDYTRKQTLTNAERYICPKLKEMETKILGAEEKMLRLESKLFGSLREAALEAYDDAHAFAQVVAELDVLRGLAEVAERNDYVRPKVDKSFEIDIEEGRHPVVESALPPGTFVPNNLRLNSKATQVAILTGPNMSGKSTFLRQNALIAILAQIGSFVPAKKARIGIVDRILTRIGAQDALAQGDSTFMVEMKETAHILNSATPRSLIVLDEVGRGTSTFDGISISWAVLEFLYSDSGGPRTLFATHYFELTELADQFKGIVNLNVQAKEWTDSKGHKEVVFLHKVGEGPADRSYGVHVGELAGLPKPLIRRAYEILDKLQSGKNPEPKSSKEAPKTDEAPLLPLFSAHPLIDELKMLDPDSMTPMEALAKLQDWKKRS